MALDDLVRDLSNRLDLAVVKIEELMKANEGLLKANHELVEVYQ